MNEILSNIMDTMKDIYRLLENLQKAVSKQWDLLIEHNERLLKLEEKLNQLEDDNK